MKPLRHQRTGRPVREARLVATHEAGHVIAALAVGLPPSRALIEPARWGGGVAGAVEHRSLDWIDHQAAVHRRSRRAPRLTRRERTQLEGDLIACCAGLAAEQVVLGGMPSQRWALTDDCEQARDVARLLGHRGWAASAYIARARRRALRIVREHWPQVQAIARRLLERERVWRWRPLDGRELRAIARGVRAR